MIGTRLGAYEITAKLGEGGMGEVWRGRDTKLDRDVAIKVLPGAFVEDAERLARFEREAKVLASLNHPNIAQIYGLETSGGINALVMELVEGPTLADRLEQGPIPFSEGLSIARQVAEALEEAHEKGIVHRDLKPQNVKASDEGKVKVLDFGLAKAMDPAVSSSGGPVTASPTLMNSPTLTAAGTQLGVILGTAAYMAPEQAKGLAVDKRADIWAFGVVLWEMLTGRRLFDGDSVPEVLADVLRTKIDLGALPAETPPAIRRLLRRCLERKPANRLRDIGDARIVIDEVLAGVEEESEAAPAPVAAPRSSWRRWTPWLGGALAGAVVGFLVAPRGAVAPVAAPAATTTIRMLVAAGESSHPDVSPDGKTLAFTSTRNREVRVWIKDLASGSESALARVPSWLPRFSPDGTGLLFATEGEGSRTDLYRIALATREERLVARDADVGDWSPDGRRVCFLRGRQRDAPIGQGYSELVALDLASGEQRVLYRDDSSSMDSARWSPDGGHVAVSLVGFQAGTLSQVGIVDVATGEATKHPLRLGEITGTQTRGIAWLSARKLALLLLDSGQRVSPAGRVATLDLESGRIEGLMPLVATGWGLDVAGAGSLVVGVGSVEQNLRQARRTPEGWSPVELLTEGPFSDRQPVFSPDGRSILFSSDRSGNLDIWRLERDSGELRRLTDHEASDWDPALSPDGKRLLFSSDRTGRFQIWIADADGASPRQVTDLENAQNPTMTGDGEWIVFTLQDAGAERNGIWRIRPDGRDAAPIATGAYLVPETGPEGLFVAFRGAAEDGHRLVRVADGTLLDVSIPFTDRYRWTVGDGIHLWAILLSEQGNSIVRYRFDPAREALGSAETVLSGEAVREAESLGVARDGSVVAFSSVAERRAQIVRVDGLAGLERP